ncbi:CRISPR-associated protein Csx20 [Aliarcobacter cryaerophilus]|uniref:CRISPR-associated protein Csx20 n=1 Tax=Aliarcobacter cryaerophilus TaxID=28198 RepID=UPI00112F35FE|nr:CRISPR-associated protein Csx20 [Aliarcobacter cryaerophilus]
MKQMFLLFSHKLTLSQEEDAINSLKVEKFIPLPKNLQDLFSNIPNDLDSLNNYLKPIKEFLKDYSINDDVALIQGDFGATYILVNFAKSLKLKAVYSTTKRVTQEFEEDGKIIKKSIFEHERFREYE